MSHILKLLITVMLAFTPTLSSAQINESDLSSIFMPSDEQRISMDFKNAQLTDVLKIFSQQSRMNFIAAADIADKEINLYLDEVPVEQALQRILAAHNLVYELDPGSDIFIVKEAQEDEPKLVTRVYQLQHATIPSSKIHRTLSASEGDSDSGEASGATGVRYAVEAVLSMDGRVVEDPRTNSLIVTDYPNRFPLIERAIVRLDVRIPQILIEVEMLDIAKNSIDELGAKWGTTPFTFSGAEKDGLLPFNEDNIFDDNIISHVPGARDSLFEEPRYRVGTMSFSGLQVALNFLRTQTDTKNLARPRILTLNNETAEINIKTDEAIGISSTSTSTEGIGEQTQEAERVETGVFLKVTPQANVTSGEILMAIEPKVIQAKTSQGFSGATEFKDPEERGTKSVLRVMDGDTIILGGLLRNDVQDIRTKVPILSRLPLVGAAFRHKDKNQTERELIIFITPHIVDRADEPAVTDHAFCSDLPVQPLLREQDMPAERKESIENELSFFEHMHQ
jgi:type II secretory pathway component GspD/PulD (secretin)